ncbi:MAG: mycothiol synthase [Acidimicrobiales bacterium]
MVQPTVEVQVHERSVPALDAAIVRLLDEVAGRRGRPAFGEHVAGLLGSWLGGRHPVGVTVATASAEEGAVDAVGVAGPADGGGLGRVIEVAVAPAAEDRRGTVVTRVVAALGDVVAAAPGATGMPVRLWVHDADEVDDDAAARCGFAVDRTLFQLRAPLPGPLRLRSRVRDDLVIRAFRPGVDEDAWVAVNNRSFAGHPEQGAWTRATLLQREGEAWFDPADLLLGEIDGRLVGSCWTRVHDEEDPPVGEIYVIGVDPDAHGSGIGRTLVLAGLERMERAGLRTAMLYVDAANDGALHLYRSLGFSLAHTDRSYVRHLSASDPPSDPANSTPAPAPAE